MRLAYTRVRPAFDVPRLADGLRDLARSLEGQGVSVAEAQVVGMSWDNYETTPMDQLQYDLCIEVPPSVDSFGTFGIHELGKFLAVEIDCDGPLQRIADAWDYLYETWFPTSTYEPDDLPSMKWFRQPPSKIRWDTWHVACSIALRNQCPN